MHPGSFANRQRAQAPPADGCGSGPLSLSAFVLSAAAERAQHVIDEQCLTALPAHFYYAFFDLLAAPPATSLIDAAGRLPGTVQRGH